jgi:hypothetical protein
MNRRQRISTRWVKDREPKVGSALRTVLIHENFAVSVHARQFFAGIAHASARPLEERMWSFDVLGIREMRNAAASAARKADLAAIALSGRLELPSSVREWLDLWLWILEDEKPVFIALFDSRSPGNTPIHTHLSSVAAKAGIDFFWGQRHVSLFPVVEVIGPHDDGIWPGSLEQELLSRLNSK